MMNEGRLFTGKRIMIIGSPGSGKSTFARKLAEITSLPLIHLDMHYWKDGWVESSKEEYKQWQRKVVEADTWIIDGNYGGSMDIRLSKADTVINFNISRWVCIGGYFKRVFTGRKRTDMPKGCPEYLDLKFIKYIWEFPQNSAEENKKRIKLYKDLHVIDFRSRGESKEFLDYVETRFPS